MGMSKADKGILEARERREKGITVWPGKCNRCKNTFKQGRFVKEGQVIYKLCDSCYEDWEKLGKSGAVRVFCLKDNGEPT